MAFRVFRRLILYSTILYYIITKQYKHYVHPYISEGEVVSTHDMT